MKYEFRIDGKTVFTMEDIALNPVYALMLMAQKMTEERERMIDEDNEPRTE